MVSPGIFEFQGHYLEVLQKKKVGANWNQPKKSPRLPGDFNTPKIMGNPTIRPDFLRIVDHQDGLRKKVTVTEWGGEPKL